jgi:hypothetical protein
MIRQLSSLTRRGEQDPATIGDRRSDKRTRTIYRIARVRARDDEGLARIRNISDGGMRLTIAIPVAAGDAIEVSLSDALLFKGSVVWTENGECGVQFAECVDSIAMLKSAAAEARVGASRPPRLSASLPAVVVTERGLRVTHLHDISQRGMKIANDGSFTPGLAVKVMIGPQVERRGYVRWVDGSLAGLILIEPFTVEELGSINAL